MNLTLARLTRYSADLSREPDGRLLGAFLNGNQDAFRELVNRHASLVFGVCQRILRHQQDAEDAFQAVFIVLARRAADVWPQDAVGSWLYGVASRVAVKARTLRDRRYAREHTLIEVAATPTPTVEPDVADVIDRVLRKLPEVYRAAIVACDLEGLSRKDAACRLGWTEGTLSGRLARARKLLADRLRKAEIVYPAAGLAVVLGSTETVRGTLTRTTLERALSSLELPSSIAPLIHGVTPGMALVHHKTVAAAILVACSLGVGAWTAGAGDGPDGITPALKPSPIAAQASPSADVKRIQEELKLLEQEVAALLEAAKLAGENPPDSVKRRLQQAEARLADLRKRLADTREQTRSTLEKPDVIPALKLLQGRWRIESVSDNNNVQAADPKKELTIEITGNTLTMHQLVSGSAVARDTYTIAVDDRRNPYTIDLIIPNKPVGHGIFAFTAPMSSCAACHKSPWPEKTDPLSDATFKTDVQLKLEQEVAALREAAKPVGENPPESVKQRLQETEARLTKLRKLLALLNQLSPSSSFVCGPGSKNANGLRLAIALAGQRPTKFGPTEGVIEFQLSRITPLDDADDAVTRARAVARLSKLLEDVKDPHDRARLKELIDKAVAEELQKTVQPPKPTNLKAILPPAPIDVDKKRLEQLQIVELEAVAELETASARAVQAKADLELKRRLLEVARANLAAAEKAPPAFPPRIAEKSPTSVSIHIRPLRDAETVVAVDVQRAKTVLEALTYAAKEMPIDPRKLSVWVVRGKDVLPVKLSAITEQGDGTTNYALKEGDKLFVQANVDK